MSKLQFSRPLGLFSFVTTSTVTSSDWISFILYICMNELTPSLSLTLFFLEGNFLVSCVVFAYVFLSCIFATCTHIILSFHFFSIVPFLVYLLPERRGLFLSDTSIGIFFDRYVVMHHVALCFNGVPSCQRSAYCLIAICI